MAFKPQLCEETKDPIRWDRPRFVSIKLDGIRATTQEGTALSRSLKPIPNHHIRNLLATVQGLDGEIIIGPPNASDVYRTTNSGTMSHDGEPNFTFYVFDAPTQPGDFQSRLAWLKSQVFPDWVQVLEQQVVTDQEELDSFYEAALNAGFEGAILRDPFSAYKNGRCTAKSQDALKLKPWTDSEAEIISLFEALENQNEAFTNELGRTARSSHAENKVGKGMLGGFNARDVHSGVEFRCAPGFLTHQEREAIWRDGPPPGSLIKYRSLAIGVKDKPRMGRFIGWRHKDDM